MNYLFRGMKHNKNEFVYGSLIKDYENNAWLISDKNSYITEVTPSSIGQYIGIRAKNKRIFEKDIIKVKNYFQESVKNKVISRDLIGEVVFNEGAFFIMGQTDNVLYPFDSINFSPSDYEVIGNTHQSIGYFLSRKKVGVL